ncbi:MAG TPA: MFS transporter [Mycobacteriales bacterium]|nr:MFS transporter [Mycobacteriales bacterium]
MVLSRRGTRGDVAVERAKVAVAAVFLINGLSFASWAARVPAIRDILGLSPGRVGLLLLSVSVGTLIALPFSGVVVARLGPARTIAVSIVLCALGLLVLAGGLALSSIPLVVPGLFCFGLGVSTCDVAMNVAGADVERKLDRTVMPRFHAGFSLGTVVGALAGAACARAGIGLDLQLVVTAVAIVAVALTAIRTFLPAPPPESAGSSRSAVLRAWREPRTLAVGVLVLAFALAEGIANDWLALSLVDGLHAAEAVGAVGFGTFVTAMTAGRVVGGSFVERYGRVPTLRVTALLVVAGVLAVVTSPGIPGALAGAVCWGLGASLGFPLGMSAAGDEESRAAARVSVVSSIGYTAFLGGPPLIGLLADHVTVRHAILAALGAALVGFLFSTAARPLRPAA